MHVPRRWGPRPASSLVRAAWLATLAGLMACTPQWDWRDVRPEGTGLVAQLPCRPSAHARKLPLAGQTREVHLLSCQVGETTWGLAWVDGVEPARLSDALLELRAAALANIGVADVLWAAPRIPGATPNPQAGRARATGRRPDGSAVSQELVVFTRGTTVYQATLLAPKLDAAAAETFFGALHFPA
jgi:hypothetical protein